MKNRILFILSFVVLSAFVFAPRIFAQNSSRSSAILADSRALALSDNRVKILREFLESNNSPLAPFSFVFVENADTYNLDWRLVAAISGVESTFGQQIPQGSYNGWGWGIYGNNVIYFSSWKDGIQTVSKSLRERYMDRAGTDNVYAVGSSYAASSAWASHVEFYMNRISDFTILNPQDSLSISL